MQIIHNPYGQQHPYEQLPEERFPRQPLAGEAFTVGIVTRPPGTVKQVIVHQSVDGHDLPAVEAIGQTDWQAKQEEGVGAEFLERIVRVEQDVWHAALNAPAFGQKLAYWIEADGERGGTYTLRGEAWQSGGGWALDGQTMTLARGSDSRPSLNGLPELVDVAWLNDGKKARRVRLTFHAQPDEGFFGLGERFNALNQRGNVLDVRVYEQYKNQGKRTYMPIPFLLSSAGYGLYVDSNRWMQFDLGAADENCWTLEADLGVDETLRLVWFTGDDPFQIVGEFTQMTGPAALPPLWAFGLWMSGNEWNSQARVEQEVQASLDHGIPPSVLVIEAWSDETTFYIWNDAQYRARPGGDAPRYGDFTFPSDGKWTDPKGMVDWLHSQDVKVLLWQIPVLKILEGTHPQHEADRTYFEANKLGVREADGTLHKVRPFWFRGGYLWDVTNPAARDWWLNKRAYLLDEVGIDGFKTDGGEHLWGEDTRFADGRGGDELWNEYPRHYSEAYYQFANQKREAVTFSRAGFTGSGRSPLHWAGDENSTWDAFRHSILAGLSAGISGVPFWGWDLGGFSGDLPSAELYLRGAAMAAFCPVMQYHSEFNQHREPNRDRTPWNIRARTGDAGLVDTFRFFVNVRRNLLPYIWREAKYSAVSGEPMMRALRLTDLAASDYQYFFGRDLLVCPVVEPDATRWNIYLPPGRWCSLWGRTEYTGGNEVQIESPLDRIPVFVRTGTSIPVCLAPSGQLGDAVNFSVTPNDVLAF
jgi:alpha-glucosidase (family GH31 glycosyl hydrolase)